MTTRTIFRVEWIDYPSAVEHHHGNEEAAADDCHNARWYRVEHFEKFRAAVKAAHEKIGRDFFGCPRVYRVEETKELDWLETEFWDCDDPDVPVFEAKPTQVLA